MTNPSSTLFWLLGTDDTGHWHQRIIRAGSAEHADRWWQLTLERDPEVLLDYPTLEQGVETLVEAAQGAGEDVIAMGAWIKDESRVGLVPVFAANVEAARALIAQQLPQVRVMAIVNLAPLLDTLMRMRAIEAGELEPDEKLI